MPIEGVNDTRKVDRRAGKAVDFVDDDYLDAPVPDVCKAATGRLLIEAW